MEERKQNISSQQTEDLTSEFNELIENISTEVINSTALKNLEETKSALNSKIPKLDRFKKEINVEIKRLEDTNNILNRLKLEESANRVEMVYQMIEENNKINQVVKENFQGIQKKQDKIIRLLNNLNKNNNEKYKKLDTDMAQRFFDQNNKIREELEEKRRGNKDEKYDELKNLIMIATGIILIAILLF